MDEPDVDPGALAHGLRDLRRVNRWLLGTAAATRLVRRLSAGLPSRRLVILDVGTGSGDVALAIARDFRRRGKEVRIIATDFHPRTLGFARAFTEGHPEIDFVVADALDLPLGTDSCDIAICTTMLHHLSDEEASRALEEMDRVSRWGVVVTDLERTRTALLGAELLARTVWRGHPVTRHDGPASVRAAFTSEELRSRASSIAGARISVRRHPFFRISLVVDRTGGDSAARGVGENRAANDSGGPARAVGARPS